MIKDNVLRIQTILLSLLIVFHLAGLMAAVNITILLLLVSLFLIPGKGRIFVELIRSRDFLIGILPFATYAISLLWTDDLKEGMRNVTTKLPLLIFPVALGMQKDLVKKENLWFYAKVFVISVAAMAVAGFIFQYGMFRQTGDAGYFYNDNLGSKFGKQAVYFAWFVNSAFCILLFGGKKLAKEWNLILRLSLFVILIGAQILLASRTSLGISILVFIVYAAILIFKGFSKLKLLVTGLLLVTTTFVIISLFPKVLNRFIRITHTEYRLDNPNPLNHFNGTYSPDNWDGLTVRLAIWECTRYTVAKHFITGFGVGDIPAELRKSYREKNFLLGQKDDFNTHNQFFDSWLAAGFFGLLLFSTAFLLMTFRSFRKKNIICGMLLITLLLSMLTENILNRNQGVVIAGILLGIIVSSHTGRHIQDQSRTNER